MSNDPVCACGHKKSEHTVSGFCLSKDSRGYPCQCFGFDDMSDLVPDATSDLRRKNKPNGEMTPDGFAIRDD